MERMSPTPKEQEVDYQLNGLLKNMGPTILDRLVLKCFEKMGYRVRLVKDAANNGVTGILEKDDEKALFRFICRNEYFDHVSVEEFAKSIKEEKINKGYFVTTGTFTAPALTLAKEEAIELVGKEELVELIHSYLDEDLGKELEKVHGELAKQTKTLDEEVSQRDMLLKELREWLTRLSENEDFLKSRLETKEAEYSEMTKNYEDIRMKFEKNKEEMKSLSLERDNLQQKISQMQDVCEVVKTENAVISLEDPDQKLAKEDGEFVNQRILEQSLAEKERTLKTMAAGIEKLHQEIRVKDELVSNLGKEKQELLQERDKSAVDKELRENLPSEDKIISDLRSESQNLIAKLGDMVFPSLDLTPLNEKGVLLKMEPEGPIVSLKRIGLNGVSFETDRRLDIHSPCDMVLIFFGSFSPLTVKGSLIWQEKVPGCLKYNVRLGYLSLNRDDKNKINEYINEKQSVLNEVKK